MPEGDTVWLHAQRLHDALAGATLAGSDFRLPRLATVDLTGYTVREVRSRGKHLLVRLVSPNGAEWTLRSHLRMDGTWRVFRPGEPWRGRPAHTIRVVLRTATVTAVGFHLHDVELVATEREIELVGHLGPDLLGPDWDPVEAARRLAADPDRQIAVAVMDQQNFAGVGNFYKCELLFLRGLSPWTPVRDVTDLSALVALAHRLLFVNRERWAQVTTGDARAGRNAYVFERAGKPCLRCRTTVRWARQGGDVVEDRITYWCPTCQPGPAPAGSTTRPGVAGREQRSTTR